MKTYFYNLFNRSVPLPNIIQESGAESGDSLLIYGPGTVTGSLETSLVQIGFYNCTITNNGSYSVFFKRKRGVVILSNVTINGPGSGSSSDDVFKRISSASAAFNTTYTGTFSGPNNFGRVEDVTVTSVTRPRLRGIKSRTNLVVNSVPPNQVD